ncbi:MAG: hypothetical protein SFZ02_01105 [bacterium]|nr:hypothetical protein [bacterium]
MADLSYVKAKVGTIEDAIESANKGGWNITIFYSEQTKKWYVYGGDQLIFNSETREMVDTFLYGMGFALTAMPDGGFEILKEIWGE